MTAVQWDADDVIAICPEFAAVDTSVIDVYIALAIPQMDSELFDELYFGAGIQLTAHMMKAMGVGDTSGTAGAAGPLSQVTVGQVSASFASAGYNIGTQGFAASLGRTTYGMEYIRYCKMVGPFADVI